MKETETGTLVTGSLCQFFFYSIISSGKEIFITIFFIDANFVILAPKSLTIQVQQHVTPSQQMLVDRT